jgi:hypothetical protein
MEQVEIKAYKRKPRAKKVKVDELNPDVKSENSLTKIIEKDINSYKYTKHGAIRQSWIRDEARKERSGNNDIIALKVKEELLRLEQKKMKEDEKERKKEEKKKEAIRLREEKILKKKMEKKPDMRGKTEKALAHNKKQGSRLQEGIYMKMRKKELERRKRDDSDSDEEEITTTVIKKKRSKSRTPDIDYRKFYEDSIKKKVIREEEEDTRKVVRSESPNIDRIRDLQRNMFKGII